MIRTKNFSWNLGLTYSYNRNKVLSLPEEYAYDEVDMYGNPTGRKAYRIGGYKMSETGYRFGGTAVGESLGVSTATRSTTSSRPRPRPTQPITTPCRKATA